MGTQQVYEEKLKRGNLYHKPTMKPGLGSARCPRCLSLLNPNSARLDEYQISPVLSDATSLGGFGIGGLLSGVYGVNTGIPYVQSRIKGPKWLTFATKIPLLLTCSGASAAFGGYALPKLLQLYVTAYYTSYSSAHYGISLLTRRIENVHTSDSATDV